MLFPNNFLYFITLFFISVLAGAYLLFSYNRNRLLLINAIMFFLIAIRACTEYYLPQIELFENARKLTIFHSFITHTVSIGVWYVSWFYIRPFKKWKREKMLNQIYFWTLIAIPGIIGFYGHYNRYFFKLNPEKIDGFWQFIATPDGLLSGFFFIHTFYIMAVVTTIPLLIGLIRDKGNRIKKVIIIIAYILFPVIYKKILVSNVGGVYMIPNIAGVYFINTLIISWFVSNYRLFEDNFSKTVTDLLDSISDLAIFTDTDFKISHANNLAFNQFSKKIIYENAVNVLSEVSQENAEKIQTYIHALANSQTKEQEIALVINDQTKLFNLKVAKYEQGNFHLGYTFLLTDLTEIKQKEQALIQLNNTKDRLFAIIGHDLRKPALAFRGISKKVNFLIQQKEFDTLNKFGETLEQSAFSLNTLLDNLLNWALKQRDVLPYDPEPVNVQQVTEEIFELFEQIAEAKGVHLQLNIPASIIAYSDPNALNTIIRNLVDNAIKYTPNGGSVQVNSEKKEDNISIVIKDTGQGMSNDQLTKIFELNKNKSTQGTSGEKGSGLGLSLVKDLVDLNKGIIKIQSKQKEGTTFEILLPAA